MKSEEQLKFQDRLRRILQDDLDAWVKLRNAPTRLAPRDQGQKP